MKKQILLFFSIFISIHLAEAQIICIQCFEQNDSIGANVRERNMIVNGGFENTNCGFNSSWNSFCPKSPFYSCEIVNWTCTGGGSASYPHFYDSTFEYVEQGSRAPYFDNLYSKIRPARIQDTVNITCAGCIVKDIPVGYPANVADCYGGATGVSLSQTVKELTPGAVYVLEFWAGGGFDSSNKNNKPGLFGVDIGFGNTFLSNKPTPPHTGVGTRFLIAFKATSASHTIKFTDWGPICASCSELILDDVRLFAPSFLPKNISLCSSTEKKEENINHVTITTDPISKDISISFNKEQKNIKIKITNAHGKKILAFNFSGKELTLESGELKKGTYFVQITEEKKNVINNKIIVK